MSHVKGVMEGLTQTTPEFKPQEPKASDALPLVHLRRR